MKRISLLVIALVMALPLISHAATIGHGDEYSLRKGAVVEDNLYAAGGLVTLTGDMQGDAHVAGGNVTVTGPVAKDLTVAGGSLLLLGDIGDDLRAAGGTITINSAVAGELLVAGGMISIMPETTVAGDAYFSGGRIILDGTFDGDVEVQGEEVEVLGTINGSLTGTMSHLVLGETASIGGDLVYKGWKEAELKEGAVVAGQTDYMVLERQTHKKDLDKDAFKGIAQAIGTVFFMLVVLKFLGYLLTAVLATVWFRKGTQAVVGATHEEFGKNLLTGFVAAVVTPVAGILLAMTGIGIIPSMLLMTTMWLLLMVGATLSGVYLGALIRSLFMKKKEIIGDWKSALLGTFALFIVVLVPLLGFLFAMVMVLTTFGTLVRKAYAECMSHR